MACVLSCSEQSKKEAWVPGLDADQESGSAVESGWTSGYVPKREQKNGMKAGSYDSRQGLLERSVVRFKVGKLKTREHQDFKRSKFE